MDSKYLSLALHNVFFTEVIDYRDIDTKNGGASKETRAWIRPLKDDKKILKYGAVHIEGLGHPSICLFGTLFRFSFPLISFSY
jgi:hypothetical protein